jgi:predicted nucleic acid-binding protein
VEVEHGSATLADRHPGTPFRDALVGATALVHRMMLVTRNIKDFVPSDGLDIIDPWKPRQPA